MCQHANTVSQSVFFCSHLRARENKTVLRLRGVPGERCGVYIADAVVYFSTFVYRETSVRVCVLCADQRIFNK